MTHAKVRRAPIPAPTPIPLAKASLEAQSALASLQEIDANVSEDQSRADGIAPNLLEGLAAFAQGKQTNIVCMDGLDLFEVISKKLDLRDVIRRKAAVTWPTAAFWLDDKDRASRHRALRVPASFV